GPSLPVLAEQLEFATTDASVMGTLPVGAGTGTSPAGAVHINMRFREPLIPQPDHLVVASDAETGVVPVVPGSQGQPRFSTDQRWHTRGHSFQEQLVEVTDLRERHTVVVAGHGAGP